MMKKFILGLILAIVSMSAIADDTAMYSYNKDLSAPQPLSGAVLDQKVVYIFFEDTPYSSIKFYCCKGIDGESNGEAHRSPITDSEAPFIYPTDLRQYGTTGTRELYVDASLPNGGGLVNISTNFSIDIMTIPPLITPTVSDVSLEWVAPTERSDNSPLYIDDIGGFKIYDTLNGAVASVTTLESNMADSHIMKDVPVGAHSYTVTAYDTDGRESIWSSAKIIQIFEDVILPPKSPTLTATVL